MISTSAASPNPTNYESALHSKGTWSKERTSQPYNPTEARRSVSTPITFIGAVRLFRHLRFRLKSTCTTVHIRTNKTKTTEDNLWAHSEHLATRSRCSLCIGCVTVSPHMWEFVLSLHSKCKRKKKNAEWAESAGWNSGKRSGFAELSKLCNLIWQWQRNTSSANPETWPGFECIQLGMHWFIGGYWGGWLVSVSVNDTSGS